MNKIKKPSFSQRLMLTRNRREHIVEKSIVADSDRILEIKQKIQNLEQEILMMKLISLLN